MSNARSRSASAPSPRAIAASRCSAPTRRMNSAHAGTAERIRERVGQGRPTSPSISTRSIPLPRRAPARPVSGGFTADAGAPHPSGLIRELDIRGMDIVEVSPPYDHADITAIAGAAMAQHYIQALALKKAGRGPGFSAFSIRARGTLSYETQGYLAFGR